MSDEYVKNADGTIRGQLHDRGGEKTVSDAAGRLRGKYNERTNTTTNQNGQIVGTGDQRTRLLDD